MKDYLPLLSCNISSILLSKYFLFIFSYVIIYFRKWFTFIFRHKNFINSLFIDVQYKIQIWAFSRFQEPRLSVLFFSFPPIASNFFLKHIIHTKWSILNQPQLSHCKSPISPIIRSREGHYVHYSAESNLMCKACLAHNYLP